MTAEQSGPPPEPAQEAIARAFGAENRARLLAWYFNDAGAITTEMPGIMSIAYCSGSIARLPSRTATSQIRLSRGEPGMHARCLSILGSQMQ
jgi:hypothetical protein